MQLRRLVQRAVVLYPPLRRAVGTEGEAVGKYLIHDAAAEPCGGLKVPAMHREAKARALAPVQPPAVSALVRAEPVRAVVGLYPEMIPQRGRSLRTRKHDAPDVPVPLCLDLRVQLVALDDESDLLHPAAAYARAQAYLFPALHGPRRAAEACVRRVMLRRGALLRRLAQYARHMGGAGLECVKRVEVYPRRAQVAAAARDRVIRRAHGEAAVVHQKAHKLRRDERVRVAAEALVHF